jgi:hypothetical protein
MVPRVRDAGYRSCKHFSGESGDSRLPSLPYRSGDIGSNPSSMSVQAEGSTFTKAQHSWTRWTPRLVVGGALNVVAWVSAWARIGPLAHYSFFPLWLGFILVADAVTEARSGTSLWRRGTASFIGLFVVSAPFWWYFERLNERVGNWHYRSERAYGTAAYIFWASLAFSTVIPAVLAVAELLRTFWPGGRQQTANSRRQEQSPPELRLPRLSWPVAVGIVGVGIGTLILALLVPDWFFPFLWLSLVVILDPVNSAAGEESIIGRLRAGRWCGIARLMLAGLVCGFFWEMWNFWSLPQWYYTVPHVGFGKVFAMPILGYGGYLPFALEIFAVYQFARLLTRSFRVFPMKYVRT